MARFAESRAKLPVDSRQHDNRIHLLVLDVAGADFRLGDLPAYAKLASVQLFAAPLGASLSLGLAGFWLAD